MALLWSSGVCFSHFCACGGIVLGFYVARCGASLHHIVRGLFEDYVSVPVLGECAPSWRAHHEQIVKVAHISDSVACLIVVSFCVVFVAIACLFASTIAVLLQFIRPSSLVQSYRTQDGRKKSVKQVKTSYSIMRK